MTEPAGYSDLPARPSLLVSVWQHPLTRFALYFALVYFSLNEILVYGPHLIPSHSYLATHSEALDALSFGLEALVAVGWLAVFVYGIERRRMSDAGFTLRGVVTETVSGYMIGLAMMSVVVGLLAICGIYHALGVNGAFRPWFLLLGYLLVGIAEETFFRGYLLRIVEYRWGSLAALIISCLVFGLAHINNTVGVSEPTYEKVTGPIFICLESLLLGAAYLATRRLWLPIGIHWAWNYFEGPVYGNDVSGTGAGESNVLIHSSMHGPILLTGGSFGPEGSIVCVIVCLAFSFLLLRVAVRAGQWKPPGEWKPQSAPRVSNLGKI